MAVGTSGLAAVDIQEQTMFVSFIGLGSDPLYALEDLLSLMKDAVRELGQLVESGRTGFPVRCEFTAVGGAAATLYVTRALEGAS